MRWLFTCTALLAAALAVFMVPSRFEGAVLLTITPKGSPRYKFESSAWLR
jgi:hypothetical protein